MEALAKEGAPPDLLQCLTRVNIPMSQALMSRADLVIATGGSRRARRLQAQAQHGVGAGNSTMVIDGTRQHRRSSLNTRLSKTSDFGSGCSAERQPDHPGKHL